MEVSAVSDGSEAESETVRRAIDAYLRSLDSSYSKRTARTAVTTWADWAAERGSLDFAVLDDADSGTRTMRRYAQRLRHRADDGHIEATTAHTYFDWLSGFLSWCVRDGHLGQNPALKQRAREALPTDDRERTQQFWDPETRDRFIDFVAERARDAVDERGTDALVELRDRAFVSLLAFSGVRGAEILRASGDSREGRQGLRWKRVDLDRGVLTVYGKSGEWERTPLPTQARSAVRRYRELLDPPRDDWPVFPTDHAPSKYRAAREGLREHGLADSEIESLLDERDVDDVLSEYGVAPPSVTVDGMRKRVRALCEEADIDIDGEYLKLHAARRGIGDVVFRKDRGAAQDLLRHRSQQTTRDAYSHIEAEERAEHVSDLIDE